VHVVAKGALIGGGVGAVLAAVRRGDGDSRAASRCLKSIAEGAVAGAGVAFLLDRRLRSQAVELVAEHGPELAEAVAELAAEVLEVATDVLDVARPRAAELAAHARDRVEHLLAS